MKKRKLLNIIFYIFIFLTILSILLLKNIGNLDEIWNYNFARNVANGLVPYRDFNIVITPLSALITGLAVKVLVNQLIVMRILAAILCALVISVIYKILNSLDIKKEISLIFTFLIGYLLKEYYCLDYNWASLLIVLILIYEEIKQYKQANDLLKVNIKNDLLLGILAGLTFTLKQTSGLLICIALLGNKLLFVRSKEELKTFWKSFFFRLIGALIPITILMLYLAVNNAIKDFISYTIKGVSGFSNYISYKNLLKMNVVGVLAIAVPFIFLYTWFKTIIKEKDKKEYLLLVYGLAIFIIAFPISDNIHFLIGAIPGIILILYELYNILLILYKKILNNKKICMYIIIFTNAFVILITTKYCIKNFMIYVEEKANFSTLNHYSYIPINEQLEEQIRQVEHYIENTDNEVIILDASAAVYMIPINRYHKDYDMLNKGNLGYEGETKIIEEINTAENTQYLILKDKYNPNWQTPLEIINYVKGTKEKVGEIQIFDIYE